MYHFAGYRTLAVAADRANDAIVPRIETALRRNPLLNVRTHRHGRLWIATQTNPSQNPCGLLRLPTGVFAYVGNPLLQTSKAANEREVLFEALTGRDFRLLSETHGTFAAVAWDELSDSLFLATDKLGTRGLYTKAEGSRFLFATSLHLLRILQEEPEAIDEQGLAENVFLGQPLSDRTVFSNTKVLNPGSVIEVDCQNSVTKHRYFDLSRTSASTLNYSDAIVVAKETFGTAVRRRLQPGLQEAFLSGGLDSRAVVGELVDQHERIRTFCAAYPNSPDDLISRKIASVFGTEHTVWHRSPAERIRLTLDPFALYAREHFPTYDRKSSQDRTIWSGDGGSVILGHVYLTENKVNLATQKPSGDIARVLFPNLETRLSRHVTNAKVRQWADLAISGVIQCLEKLEHADPHRRLFYFYVENDQARHLYHHFEHIDLTQIELATPFFDSDIASLVSSLPIAWFLNHKFYNDWIQSFRCGASSVYWQAYPGHLPSPNPPLKTLTDQWNPNWYKGSRVRKSYRKLAGEILKQHHGLASTYISRPLLLLAMLTSLCGSSRMDYEIAFAHRLVQSLGNPTSEPSRPAVSFGTATA